MKIGAGIEEDGGQAIIESGMRIFKVHLVLAHLHRGVKYIPLPASHPG